MSKKERQTEPNLQFSSDGARMLVVFHARSLAHYHRPILSPEHVVLVGKGANKKSSNHLHIFI